MAPNLVSKLKRVKEKSTHVQHKHSAVILLKGRPLSFGFNKMRTDPKIAKYSDVKQTHAEMSAIWQVKNKEILRGATIVVYREDKNGNMANSKPCVACTALIKECGFKNVTYSTPTGWVEICI